MKKILIALMAVAVTLSSCSSVFGLSGASTGAMVGGTLGSILGNSTGRYGSTIGGLVGTMAGAAVSCCAVSTSRNFNFFLPTFAVRSTNTFSKSAHLLCA